MMSHKKRKRRKKPKPLNPYLYLMWLPEVSLVKVGHTTKSPHERAKQLFYKTGFYHQVVWAREVLHGTVVEKHIQRALAPFRVHEFNGYEYFAVGVNKKQVDMYARCLLDAIREL